MPSKTIITAFILLFLLNMGSSGLVLAEEPQVPFFQFLPQIGYLSGGTRLMPPTSRSYYISNTEYDEMEELGREYANSMPLNPAVNQDYRLVFLLFGFPSYDAENDVYGVRIYAKEDPLDSNSINVFQNLTQVENAVVAFVQGYTDRSQERNVELPIDLYTPPLRIAVSTSNLASLTFTLNDVHGSQWAELTSRVRSRIESNEFDLRTRIVGGIDSEPGWNSPEPTLDWFDGFLATDSEPTLDPFVSNQLFFFGTAGGCASTEDFPSLMSPPIINCSDNIYMWNLEQVLGMTARANISVVPQIYTEDQSNGLNSNARQWHQIALQAKRFSVAQPFFAGVLTQYDICLLPRSCEVGLDNTPREAWGYLTDELRSTSETVDLISDIVYSSGMFWQENEPFFDPIATGGK